MRHRTVLEYRSYRYLKVATLVSLASLIAYVVARPPEEGPQFPFGSTWTGYALGTLGALLIVWLLWFGVRKRSYSSGGSVQGWLSAHVYLGAALIVIATLHAGFSFGWNIHTLAYALMMLVILSGFYGIFVYVRVPNLISQNMAEDTLEALLSEINDLDRDAARIALQLPDEVNRAVARSAKGTRIGGGVLRQLRGRQARDPNVLAITLLEKLSKQFKDDQATHARELYAILVRKQNLVARARRELRLKAVLQFWLFFHVPLSIGLVVALTAHIVSVFFYW
ncbi:MAG: hypothetical protein ABSF50_09375 [Burkholderiaceae bacterium]|jgi:hypothetical protein